MLIEHLSRRLTSRGEVYKINTASYHFTTFAFLPLLAAAKSVGNYPEPGNVINLSSMSGVTKTSQRGQFNYNASKAATISLSKMLATEFARRNLGVRVNCVCPGFFPSGMSVFEEGVTAEEFRGYWGIPFARPGGAVDYAQCIFGLITVSTSPRRR
jgi:NAD(P)-dependent dehydrogenase (short-subunit alcohol dehydrogenase family)